MIAQPYPLWCAEIINDDPIPVDDRLAVGRVIGWLPGEGDYKDSTWSTTALVALVDADGATSEVVHHRLLGPGRLDRGGDVLYFGDSREEAMDRARQAAQRPRRATVQPGDGG